MSGAFTEGSWNGFINISETGFNIVIYVNDGNGHTGRSFPISVYQMNPTPISSANSTPTPSVPDALSFLGVIFLLAVVSVSLVYIKSDSPKLLSKKSKTS